MIGQKGQITGMKLDDANFLLKLLKAGAFPVPLKVVQHEDVDATLGQDSVQKSVIAGEIAMLVIMLFMVLYYRLPGLIASNILIFERMKEELRAGRSLVVAMEEGFHRAWSSIRDSNVSTLITAAILFWFGDQFGASLVKGFALTLAIGVLISMFSAIVVTRTFLRIVISIPAARKPVLWVAQIHSKGDGGSPEQMSLPTGGGS